MSRPTSVRLPENLWERIKAAAAKLGISATAWLIIACEEKLEGKK